MKEKPLYLFDLDGTLCLTDRSLQPDAEHQCFPESWRPFYEAAAAFPPNRPVVRIMHRLLQAGCDVWIATARSAMHRRETLIWLARNTLLRPGIDGSRLIMREPNDLRHDVDVKQDFIDALGADRDRLIAVFEDRDSVVEVWRRNGIACMQVAPGAF